MELTLYLLEKGGLTTDMIPESTPLPSDYRLKALASQPGAAGTVHRHVRPSAPPRPNGSQPLSPVRSLTPVPGTHRLPNSLDAVPKLSSGVMSRDTVPKPFFPKEPTPPPQQVVARPAADTTPRPAAPITPQPPTQRHPVAPAPPPPQIRTPPIRLERSPLHTPPERGMETTGRTVPSVVQPDPSLADTKVPRPPVQVGKTQVYRVVRPYKSQTSLDVPCRACGTLYPQDAGHCPSCGQPRNLR
jgi:hypothetical protein